MLLRLATSRRPASLQTRLATALLLSALVPLLALGAGLLALEKMLLERQAARELQGLALGLAGQLDAYLTARLQEAQAIAGLPQIATMDPEQQAPFLAELFLGFPEFSRLSTFRLDGVRLASSHPGGVPSIAVRASFQTAARDGRPAWEVAPALSTGRPSLLVHTPIRDQDRRLQGVLGAVIDLESIARAVGGIPVGPAGRAFVLDAQGRVVAHPDAAYLLQRRRDTSVDLPSGPMIVAPGVVTYRAGQEQWIAGYAPVPQLGWAVFVEQPAASVLAPARQVIGATALGLALAALLAIAIAGILSGALVRPVRQLAAAARAMRLGDLSTPLPALAPDDPDLGALVTEFDAMRSALGRRLAQLEALASLGRAATAAAGPGAVAEASLDVALTLPHVVAAALLVYDDRELSFLGAGPDRAQSTTAGPVADSATATPAGPDGPAAGSRRLVCLAHRGEAASWLARGLPLVGGTALDCAAAGTGLYVLEQARARLAQEFPAAAGLLPDGAALVAVPLCLGATPLGLLCLFTAVPWPHGRPDVEQGAFLTALADQAALALHSIELRQAAERRAAEARAAYDELRAAQAQLINSEKLRALGQMASGVAHDFNNLLGAILGHVELLLLRSDLPAEARDALTAVRLAALDGGATVRRLQEYTRVRADRQAFSRLALAEVVAATLTLTEPRWRHEAQRRGVHVAVASDVPADLVVQGNAAELREALTNLLFNALDAMPQGGRIEITGRREGGHAILRVRDTGLGMTEDVRQRCLEPFFTTKPAGNGLGLAMVAGIVARHGGRVWIESAAGQGTTITLALPCAPASEASEALERTEGTDQTPCRPARRPHILVVEDEPALGMLAARILRLDGYYVTVCTSAADALAALERNAEHNAVDLVLTDLGMPEMNGLELARLVKQRAPRILVGLLSGWAAEVSERERVEAGIDLVLAKPVRAADLRRSVAAALTARATRQAEGQTSSGGSLPVTEQRSREPPSQPARSRQV